MFQIRTCLLTVGVTLVSPGLVSSHMSVHGQLAPPQPTATQAPARDVAPQKAGTARIRGRVVAGDTGLPLRKVQLRASSATMQNTRVTSTDADGYYELKDLPAGRYQISATKGGFVSLSYGQSRPFEAGKPLEVADRQVMDKVDFALPRGGVIAGRVLDEFGEPVVDVRVMAMRDSYVQGRRQLSVSGRQSTTNDIGEYRIFGLAPGQYVVAARHTPGTTTMDVSSDDRSGYAPTYYPGTADASYAARLTIGIGQALTYIDMPLLPTRTASVSGMASDAHGQPLSSGLIMVLQRSGSTIMATGGTQVRPDGTFTVSNLAPGEYLLRAVNPGAGDRSEMATGHVTVAGEDVTGVQLRGLQAITATGRVIVDPAFLASVPAAKIQLMAVPARPEDDVVPSLAIARIDDDYTFELQTRPGTALIRVDVPPGWALEAVRHDGRDVTDTGIEFRPDKGTGDIEVELTNQVAGVSGAVTNSRGDPVADYTVVVFSTDRERRGYMSRFFRTARPDQTGRYTVLPLPAGEYYAIALEYVEAGEASDPEFLERVQAGATLFRLNDGETKVLDLTRR